MKGINVFLADDDADDREFFAFACDEIDAVINLKHFENGQLLIEGLENNSPLPDAIFLDINMPKMDGFQCLSTMRKSDKFKDLCIIMYSTSNTRTEVNRSHALGANGFVQKPSTFAELKSILENVFATDWKDSCSKLDEMNFVVRPDTFKGR